MAAICAVLDTLVPGDKVNKNIFLPFLISNLISPKTFDQGLNSRSKVVASNQLYGGTLAQIQALPNRFDGFVLTIY